MGGSINNIQIKVRKRWFTAKEALIFYFKADTVHEIDSPFLFDLLRNILEEEASHDFIQKIDRLKQNIFASKEKFIRFDLGHGSQKPKHNESELELGDWAKSSSINNYFGERLFKLCAYLKPMQMIELGTGAGISAAYLAGGNTDGKLISLEADPYLCKIARQNIKSLELHNVTILEGDFKNSLHLVLNKLNRADLVFIDGYHQSQALFNQLNILYPHLNNLKIVIIDDIRWSEDMYFAWQKLVEDDRWNISLDLYRIGILIQNPDIKHRINRMIIATRWKLLSLGLFR